MPKVRNLWQAVVLTVICFIALSRECLLAQPGKNAGNGAQWSIDILKVEDPFGRQLSFPSLAAKDDTVAIAADYFPWSLRPTEPTGMLVLYPGGRVVLPAGYGTGYPKVVYDRTGVLHLVWAEFAAPASSVQAWMSGVRAVWHAAYSSRRWSTPERVVVAQRLMWNDDVGNVAVDGENRLHVLLQKYDSSSGGFTDYVRVDGHWVPQVIVPMASASGMTLMSNGALVAVFAAYDFTAHERKIWCTAYSTALRSWGPLSPIAVPSAQVTRLRLVASSSEASAIWIESADDTGGATLVRAVLDTGASRWSEVSRVRLDETPRRLAVIETPCDRVTVFMIGRPSTATGVQLAVVEWKGKSLVRSPESIPVPTAIDVGAVSTRDLSVVAINALGADGATNLVAHRASCSREDQ